MSLFVIGVLLCMVAFLVEVGPVLSQFGEFTFAGLGSGFNNEAVDEIRVVGAGMGRTGTASLQAALEILGYRSYHFFEMMQDRHHAERWAAFAEGNATREEILDMLVQAGFNATVDNPASDLYLAQLRRFPNAKVILSVRDSGEEWARSWKTIMSLDPITDAPFSLAFPNFFQWMPHHVHIKATRCIFGSHLGLPPCAMSAGWRDEPDPDAWLATQYRLHNEQVVANVPAGQLLTFNVKEGWGPLCAFLGVPEPNLPFPKGNDSGSIRRLRTMLLVVIYGWIPCLLLLGAGLVWRCCLGSAPRSDSKNKAAWNGGRPMFKVVQAGDETTLPFPLIGLTKAYWTGLFHNPYCPAGCSPQVGFEFTWEDEDRIDVERLGRCFDELIQRNGIFRAVVMRDNPTMRYLEPHEVHRIKFSVEVLPDGGNVDTQCDAVFSSIFDRPIDPFTFPLFRGCVVHLPTGGSRFYFCASLFIMGFNCVTDLTWRLHISNLYHGKALPPTPKLTYKAYNDGYLSGCTGIQQATRWQAARAFWVAKIAAGLPPPPQLPMLRESALNPGTFSHYGGVPITAEQFRNLKVAAARFDLTPSSVLLALYCIALSRRSASHRMLINVVDSLRHDVHEDSGHVLGNFGSSTLCPVDVSGLTSSESIVMIARSILAVLTECQENNAISGIDVMSMINASGSAIGHAAAPFIFVPALCHSDFVPGWRQLCFQERRVVEKTVGAFMVNAIKEYPDGSLYCGFSVVDNAFTSETIHAIVNDHRKLLEAITLGDGGTIKEEGWHLRPSDLLDPVPRPTSLGPPLAPTPGILLHDPLREHAICIPSKIALIDAGFQRKLSYHQYACKVLAVAQRLVASGVPDGFARYGSPLVAIGCQRGWQQVVGCVGILTAGCAYLPINTVAWPPDRCASVIQAGEAVAIVTSTSTLAALPWLHEQLLLVVDVDEVVLSADEYLELPLTKSDCSIRQSTDLAYCIFTSGSTGKPKGVAMSHGAALNTIRALVDIHQLESSYAVLGLSHASFDLSVSDIFLTLRVGGTLIIPSDSMISPPSPAQWRSTAAEHGVTAWNTVPGLFALLVEQAETRGERLPPSLTAVWLSGDTIPESLPSRSQAITSQAMSIFAMGGATEAGIWSNAVDITNHKPQDGAVPYGNALPSQGMYVVRTEDLDVAAPGVPGMIVISGGSLMIGYYNDPDLTGKALVDVKGERVYLTHDAGYTRWRGATLEIMITGRIQSDSGYVKVRGFRVEFQEVEAVLRLSKLVQNSVVAIHDGVLVAYVVMVDGATALSRDVQKELLAVMAEKLPVYAQPRCVEVLSAIPLSSNGKVDRAALPPPSSQAGVPTSTDRIEADALETAILEAAQEIGIKVRSREDDIFTSGADSVAALRFAFKLEAAHRVQLNVNTLFNDGRIATIAVAIRDAASSVGLIGYPATMQLSTLVAAPKTSGKPALFLCHGAGTTALALSSFGAAAVEIGLCGQVYGVSDTFMTSMAATFGYGCIEDVGSAMADLVQGSVSENDAGPVALGGWSYGGVVAFACARVLESRGVCVRFVVMIDSPMGQEKGFGLDKEMQEALISTAGEEIAKRSAEHIVGCNKIMDEYHPLGGVPLTTTVFDIRPPASKVDHLSQMEREALAVCWHRIIVDGADHFTLVHSGKFIRRAVGDVKNTLLADC